jgi:hypothetical protein
MSNGRLDLSQPLSPIPGTWGRWRLDRENLRLVHEERYELELTKFRTAAAMLDMIVQVRHKVFMEWEDVGSCVAALDDLFDIQPSLTPQGQAREIEDVAAYLASRFERRGLLEE